MALRSKLLDEKVVKSVEKILKKVKKNAYISKKTKCYNCNKKVQYSGCSTKIYSLSRKALGLGIKIKLGRHNFYLYSAVNPKMERVLAYLHPMLNTDCMNIFLKQMLQYLGTREDVLVMDCASWHKPKNLKVPKNIELYTCLHIHLNSILLRGFDYI